MGTHKYNYNNYFEWAEILMDGTAFAEATLVYINKCQGMYRRKTVTESDLKALEIISCVITELQEHANELVKQGKFKETKIQK
jgi:hypothetical protein